MRSLLDTASMAMTVNGLYEYVVTDFGNPLSLLNVPPYVFAVHHLSCRVVLKLKHVAVSWQ